MSHVSGSVRSHVALLPLRTGVLFPGTMLSFSVGRPRSIALLHQLSPGDLIAVASQKDAANLDPREDDLHRYGTYARVQKIARKSDHEFQLVLQGVGRVALSSLTEVEPFWKAEVTALEDNNGDTDEARVLATALREQILSYFGQDGGALSQLADSTEHAGLLADQIAGQLGLETEQEIEILATLDVPTRLKLVAQRLVEAKARAEVRTKIDGEVRREVGKNQRDAVLREQLRAIRKELGEDGADELDSLRQKLDAATLTEDARKVVDRELRKLEKMGGQGAEANVSRNYLEFISELPWDKRAEANNDLDAISARLDQDHHALGDVKKRVLEHMAVLKLSGNRRGSLLCLAGPPGVGKTSIATSIAEATGRPFVRVSLGGVRDEAEIRGHRRTYVGALPGRIMHAVRKAGVRNPVILLDEIDKLFSGWAGSPEAALLEVLDPEQNKTFQDHYLELPFDLSEVLFIATANTLDTLSGPLRDRLEILEVSGYTPDEKRHIARNHLLSKRVKDHGIPVEALTVDDSALDTIIRDYTREAGVRQLDREISKLCRSVALDVARAAEGQGPTVVVTASDVEKYLGRARFHADKAERSAQPGVATGLAWTPFGGDILFIETSKMPGKGRLEITGQLGDVMKESARAALTFTRSNADQLGIEADAFETHDLHIHVPAGGVPKDGPSAGVTMFTAIASLLTGRAVRPDTAMTGECTLRGRVLPVGGIKAKVLAAHRAGIARVILPLQNARDLEEVPAEIRATMEFHLVDDMSQALRLALEPTVAATAGPVPVRVVDETTASPAV